MSWEPTGDWIATNPSTFMDRRSQYRRDVGLVTFGVRAYRGNISRRLRNTETGKHRWEHDHCPHAHNKLGAARKCGIAEARRRNRMDKRGESYEVAS